jgi:hypothetical protein
VAAPLFLVCPSNLDIKRRIADDLDRILVVSATSNEYQPKEIKWATIPEYLVQYLERPHHWAFLGACIAAKVRFSHSDCLFERRLRPHYSPGLQPVRA